MKITPQEFELLAAYIFKISGITLNESKKYLVENRLTPLLREYGYATYQELYNKSQVDKNGHLRRDIIDAISTNETFFFRDTKPFDLLRNKIIPELIDHRRSQGFRKIPLRIWSAACSTGQEVYTIGMTLLEMLPNINDFEISILGTDISAQAIQRASYGKYNQFEMQRGLPEPYRQKYFTRHGDGWRIKDNVRSLAQFQKINLLRPFSDQIHGFDIVFCRNVAIYFNKTDKQRLFTNISKVLVKDGALLVGGSETLSNISTLFQSQQYLRTIFYTLNTDQSGSPMVSPPAPPRVQPQRAAPRRPATQRPATRPPSPPAPPPRPRTVAQPRVVVVTPPPPPVASKTMVSSSPAKPEKTSLLSKLTTRHQKESSTVTSSAEEQIKPKKSLLAIIAEKKKKKD